MTGEEVIEKVKKLKFSLGEYAVYGSGILAVKGLREIYDIDLIVLPKLYSRLKKTGWVESISKNTGSKYISSGVFEVYKDWNFGNYVPDIKSLIKDSIYVEGVPFVGFKEILKWKKAYGREKDFNDIALIKKYLRSL